MGHGKRKRTKTQTSKSQQHQQRYALYETYLVENMEKILTNAFLSIDADFIGQIRESYHHGMRKMITTGACGIVSVMDKKNGFIHTANAGDCRAVLGQKIVVKADALPMDST